MTTPKPTAGARGRTVSLPYGEGHAHLMQTPTGWFAARNREQTGPHPSALSALKAARLDPDLFPTPTKENDVDPNVTFENMLQDLKSGDLTSAGENADHLYRWLCAGGFPPTSWEGPDRFKLVGLCVFLMTLGGSR